MATAPIGAVVDYFATTSAALTVQVSGGLWLDEIPEDWAGKLPLCALFHDADEEAQYLAPPVSPLPPRFRRLSRFHFEGYAIGLDAVQQLAVQIEKAYNLPRTDLAMACLRIDGCQVMGCALGVTKYALAGEITATSQKVYMATVNVSIMGNYDGTFPGGALPPIPEPA